MKWKKTARKRRQNLSTMKTVSGSRVRKRSGIGREFKIMSFYKIEN